MDGYVNSTIRIKLSDFLGKPFEEQVYEKLSLLGSVGQHPFPIYFWYDGKKDKITQTQMKEFIKKGKPIIAICRGFQLVASKTKSKTNYRIFSYFSNFFHSLAQGECSNK